MTKEQEQLIVEAHSKIKQAFPDSSLQFSFNLSKKHDNVNYNIKESGILKPAKKEA